MSKRIASSPRRDYGVGMRTRGDEMAVHSSVMFGYNARPLFGSEVAPECLNQVRGRGYLVRVHLRAIEKVAGVELFGFLLSPLVPRGERRKYIF